MIINFFMGYLGTKSYCSGTGGVSNHGLFCLRKSNLVPSLAMTVVSAMISPRRWGDFCLNKKYTSMRDSGRAKIAEKIQPQYGKMIKNNGTVKGKFLMKD